MPALRTYARPVDDMVMVKIPKEYAAYSFQVILVPCSVKPECTPSPDIHVFDALHSDWGGEGSADAIAESIRASRRVERLTATW